MEKFKKNSGFFLGLFGLSLLFVAGCFFAVTGWMEKGVSDLNLKRSVDASKVLLAGHAFVPGAGPVSLTPTNVEAAKHDLDELMAHEVSLRESIAGEDDFALLGKPSLSASELNSLIKQSVDEWKRFAIDREIRMMPNDQCDFGFRRYIRNPGTSPKRELQRVDQQRRIIEDLCRQLADSRQNGSQLLLVSVDREPVETYVMIPEGRPNAGTLGPEAEGARIEADEFVPARTFRRAHLVDSLAFRLRFAGSTSTLRTYVNKLRNSGRPYAITSVEVSAASPEAVRLLTPVVSPLNNGAAPGLPGFLISDEAAGAQKPAPGATPKEERQVVVKETPSEFVVQLEYLIVIPKEKPDASGEPKK